MALAAGLTRRTALYINRLRGAQNRDPNGGSVQCKTAAGRVDHVDGGLQLIA